MEGMVSGALKGLETSFCAQYSWLQKDLFSFSASRFLLTNLHCTRHDEMWELCLVLSCFVFAGDCL